VFIPIPVFLPMAIGLFILLGPEMAAGPYHLLYAAFFVTLAGPAIALVRGRRGWRREWLFIGLCGALAVWSVYRAFEAWGGPAS